MKECEGWSERIAWSFVFATFLGVSRRGCSGAADLMISGSMCSAFLTQSYQLPVMDTMFVRKKHRGKDFGLLMLEDFVDSFTENIIIGLRFPLTSFMHAGKTFSLMASLQITFLNFRTSLNFFKGKLCM